MNKLCLLAIFVIGFVGVYDNCMNVIYSETLISMEENPVGSFILTYNVTSEELIAHNRGLETSTSIHENLLLFVLYKASGTLLVLAACIVLCKTKYRAAIIVIAIIQGLLFYYLSFKGQEHPGDYRLNKENTPISKFINMNKKYYLQ